MANIQNPAIGNALRVALDLQGAGGFPMEADSVVVPVAIVADITQQAVRKIVPAWGLCEVPAVAANSQVAALLFLATAAQLGVKQILVDAVTIRSSAATSVHIGAVNRSISLAIAQAARRKDAELVASSLGAAVYSTTTGSAPLTFLPEAALAVGVPAEGVRIVLAEPVVLSGTNQALIVVNDTQNQSLLVSYEWREIRD